MTHRLRVLAVARLLVPEAVACGRSAAVLWGIELAGPDDDVECTVPAGTNCGAVSGVLLNRRTLRTGEVTSRRGIHVTTAARTALDLARIRPPDEAVVALDQFLRPGIVLAEELRAAAATIAGRDCRRIRTVAGLADGLAESPQESRLRLLIGRSDLPAPVAQFTVQAGGRWVARVDFAWPEHKLALEYEGRWHGEGQNVAKDRRRLNALTAAGWRVLFVTAEDLRDPARLAARIRSALGISPRSA